MAIIQLHSDNPNLSWIIEKNPATGMTLKSLRQGTLFGWFGKENTSYNILFRDGQDEVSYKSHPDEDFEYLNASRYNYTLFIVNAIDDFLRTAFKKRNEKDLESVYTNSFFINMMNIKNKRIVDNFNNYFLNEFKIESELIVGNNYKIKITTKKSIHELINYLSLFSIFNAILNDEMHFIADLLVKKYISCMNIIDAPYFIRYLFKVKCIPSKSLFEECKPILENSKRDKIELSFGDTWLGRKDFIVKNLSFQNNILEIGCGEGRYITLIAQKLKEEKQYFAIDTNEEVLKNAQRRTENKNLENVMFYKSLEEFLDIGYTENRTECIITEVIEHMSIEESKKLLEKAFKITSIDKFIITTPNSSFNKFYLFEDEEKRHEDHKFEFNKEDFKKFIEDCIGDLIFKAEFFDVGDKVNGISCTSGCVIAKN